LFEVKLYSGQFEKQKQAVQSNERQRQIAGDTSAAGLLRQLSEQRKNLQRDVDDFRTQLIGKEVFYSYFFQFCNFFQGAKRRGSLIREPTEVQTQRHYDTTFNINGSIKRETLAQHDTCATRHLRTTTLSQRDTCAPGHLCNETFAQ
jgi:hypothetical protein